MQEIITLHLKESDVQHAREHGLEATVLGLLATKTGTLWRMTTCGVGVEIMTPHRTFRLVDESLAMQSAFQKQGTLAPCDVQVEIHIPEPNEPQPEF